MVLTITQHRRMCGISQLFRLSMCACVYLGADTSLTLKQYCSQQTLSVFQKETGIPYNKMLFYDDEDRNVHRVRMPSSMIARGACTWHR